LHQAFRGVSLIFWEAFLGVYLMGIAFSGVFGLGQIYLLAYGSSECFLVVKFSMNGILLPSKIWSSCRWSDEARVRSA
jgi:hypothetical protein